MQGLGSWENLWQSSALTFMRCSPKVSQWGECRRFGFVSIRHSPDLHTNTEQVSKENSGRDQGQGPDQLPRQEGRCWKSFWQLLLTMLLFSQHPDLRAQLLSNRADFAHQLPSPGKRWGWRTCWCHQHLDTTWDIWTCARFRYRPWEKKEESSTRRRAANVRSWTWAKDLPLSQTRPMHLYTGPH